MSIGGKPLGQRPLTSFRSGRRWMIFSHGYPRSERKCTSAKAQRQELSSWEFHYDTHGNPRNGLSREQINCSAGCLFQPDVGRPNHLAPLGRFVGKELAEFVRRERKPVPPRAAKRALMLGSASVPLAHRARASRRLRSSAEIRSRSEHPGSASTHVAVEPANARSLAVLTYSIDPAIPANDVATCSARRSLKAGPAPRYGT